LSLELVKNILIQLHIELLSLWFVKTRRWLCGPGRSQAFENPRTRKRVVWKCTSMCHSLDAGEDASRNAQRDLCRLWSVD